MNWQQMLIADNKTILNDHGTDITITDPDGTEYLSSGQVIHVDATIDPTTGMQIYEKKLIVTVPLADFMPFVYPPEDYYGESAPSAVVSMKGWKVTTTDATGLEMHRKIAEARYDRSIGFVNLVCEMYDDESEGFR
jgi:hypothetical protein